MADRVFNIAKGRQVYYASLPAANDALICIPLEAAGLEADATIIDYDNVSLLLAGTSNEQSTIGRKTLASIIITVDDTNDRVDVDCADIVWTAATGNQIGGIIICYDGDTTAGDDTNLIPVTKHDFSVTPNGSDITGQIATSGFTRAS